MANRPVFLRLIAYSPGPGAADRRQQYLTAGHVRRQRRAPGILSPRYSDQMANRRASITDLAKTLGLSPSTISRALSDHNDVSDATKARVRALAEELHYQPNQLAAALPYEYRALRLLKQVQQQTRAFVKKAGFTPPPMPEATLRLTGELA